MGHSSQWYRETKEKMKKADQSSLGALPFRLLFAAVTLPGSLFPDRNSPRRIHSPRCLKGFGM